MPDQRIKGQEVEILYTRRGVLEDTLTDTQDFEWDIELELIDKGYLGEKSNRRDEIFNGSSFTGTIHTHSQLFISYFQGIINRAKRIEVDTVFNITAALSFPNGQTPTVTFPDAHFKPINNTVRSRGDYLSCKIQGACDDIVFTTS